MMRTKSLKWRAARAAHPLSLLGRLRSLYMAPAKPRTIRLAFKFLMFTLRRVARRGCVATAADVLCTARSDGLWRYAGTAVRGPTWVKTHRSGDGECTADEPPIAVGLVQRGERGMCASNGRRQTGPSRPPTNALPRSAFTGALNLVSVQGPVRSPAGPPQTLLVTIGSVVN